jgi:hypothetical protein
MKSLSFGLSALAIVLSSGSTAHAQARQHDGFMARFTGGIGYGSATEEVDIPAAGLSTDFTLSGVGGMFSFDVGGSPVENLVLTARFGGMSVSSPTAEIDGQEVDFEETLGEDDSAVTFVLLGPAVTYYVMPANLYFTAAFGLGLVGVTVGNRDGQTDPGWALNLDVGWEFWVGQSWGLGPALRFFYTSAPDDVDGTDDDPSVNGVGFGVLFSATYQ